MFKTVSRAKNFVAINVFVALEKLAYRKDSRLLEEAQKEYDAMIAESQAKIGPYKPVPYVPVVWA